MKMSLTWIQSLRLAAVLEDCADQLDILGYTFKVQIDREPDAAMSQEKDRLTKLGRDCQYISQQVSKLHLELEEKQSFSSLLQVVEEEEQKREAENMRRETIGELVQRRQTVMRLNEEIIQKKMKLQDLKQQASDLKHQLYNQSSQIAEKKKLEEKNIERELQKTHWETTQAEKLLEKKLELVQRKLKEEERAHKESEKFLQNRYKELLQLLQQKQQSTGQMLQEKEEQLNSVCRKRTVNLDRLMEMKRKIREMEQVVMEDREEQEKLRHQQAEVKAATKLQAWWRGCMVRLGLGSFKKTEEGQKGKKKKEGKKKRKK